LRLTIVFEDLRGEIVAKNEQGTLFVKTATGRFEPIGSYDVRVVDGEKVLIGTQPFAQDMPIT